MNATKGQSKTSTRCSSDSIARTVEQTDTEYSYNQIGDGVDDSIYLRRPTPKRNTPNLSPHLFTRECTSPIRQEHRSDSSFIYPICQQSLLRELTPFITYQYAPNPDTIINSGIPTELRQPCGQAQKQGCQLKSAFVPITRLRPPETTTPRTICQVINQIFTRELVHYTNIPHRYWSNYRRPHIPPSHRRNIRLI